METKNRSLAKPANRVSEWLPHEEAAESERANEKPLFSRIWCHSQEWHVHKDESAHEDFARILQPPAKKSTGEDFFWTTSFSAPNVARAKAVRDASAHGIGADWAAVAWELMARLQLERRIDGLERQIKNINENVNRLKEHCEKLLHGPIVVPVSTFAPEPFEIIDELKVVVRPEQECFVATLFDANLSSSGDTPEEAVANLKDLIIMVLKDFEGERDENLGPMMRRQKHSLFSLIRRR